MSSLKPSEKNDFEHLLGMSSGYVGSFTDRSFTTFFLDVVGVDIDHAKYCREGGSKAKRLRAFWSVESDEVVGRVLAEMLELWASQNLTKSEDERIRYARCEAIVQRLQGRNAKKQPTEEDFLDKEFVGADLRGLQIDQALVGILESRIREAEMCLSSGAPLSTIFMCGSVLEGLLLGTAGTYPRVFNESPSAPRDRATNKARKHPEWSLAQLIDVAHAEGFLSLDVKKFSSSLREFRNYIHPYQQRLSGFEPDEHTARICLQVLRAAIASLKGHRARWR